MMKSILGTVSAVYKFSAERFQSTHARKLSNGKLEASSWCAQIKLLPFLMAD